MLELQAIGAVCGGGTLFLRGGREAVRGDGQKRRSKTVRGAVKGGQRGQRGMEAAVRVRLEVG